MLAVIFPVVVNHPAGSSPDVAFSEPSPAPFQVDNVRCLSARCSSFLRALCLCLTFKSMGLIAALPLLHSGFLQGEDWPVQICTSGAQHPPHLAHSRSFRKCLVRAAAESCFTH